MNITRVIIRIVRKRKKIYKYYKICDAKKIIIINKREIIEYLKRRSISIITHINY